jgi:hypothetical protein
MTADSVFRKIDKWMNLMPKGFNSVPTENNAEKIHGNTKQTEWPGSDRGWGPITMNIEGDNERYGFTRT